MSLQTYVRDNLNRIVLGTGGIGLIITGIAALSNRTPAHQVRNTSDVVTWEAKLDGSGSASGSWIFGSGSLKNTIFADGRTMFNNVTYRFPYSDGSATGRVLKTNGAGQLSWSADTDTDAQSLFQTVAVSGQSDVVADSATDTLTLVAGSNVTLTTSAGGDSVTIAAAGGGGGGGSTSTGSIAAFGDNRWVNVAGDTMTGSLRNTADISAAGTVSGATVKATGVLAASGGLSVDGGMSGRTLNGAGLYGCTGATAKLVWSNGKFDCGTDVDTSLTQEQVEDFAGGMVTGNTETLIAVSYDDSGGKLDFVVDSSVIVSSEIDSFSELDTLVADKTLVNEEDAVTWDSAHTFSSLVSMNGPLRVRGSMSGYGLYVWTLSGAGLTDCDAATQTLGWDSTTEQFTCGTDSDTIYSYTNTGGMLLTADGRFVNIAGDTMTGQLTVNVKNGTNDTLAYEAPGISSGYHLHAQGLLTASGAVSVDGSLSGRTLFGTGLYDCDTASTSKLLYDLSTGKFACGTDTDTDTTYTAGANLTLNGTTFRLNATITGSTLIIRGNMSGKTLTVSDLRSCDTLDTDAAGNLTCGTDSTGTAYSFAEIGGWTVNDTGDTMTGALTILVTGGNKDTQALEVPHTVSGYIVHANLGLFSSGALSVDASMSGQSLFGAGLYDCDTGATSKVLYDVSTGKFSCGTDTDTNTDAISFSGLDGTWVNQAGDTMTGALNILVTAGGKDTVSLETPHTISGTHLHAHNLFTSSGAISVEGNATFAAGNTTAATVRREATNQFASFTVNTAGTDQWSFQLRNDSTDNLHIRDNVNGKSVLRFLQGVGVASGDTIFAQRALSTSGSLSVDGPMSGRTLAGAGLYDCDGATSKILWDATGLLFLCGTDDDVPESGDFAAAGDLESDGTITDGVIDKADLTASTDFGNISTDGSSNLTIDDGTIVEPDLDADNSPNDADILTYDSTGTNFAWITPNAGTDLTADLEEETHGTEHDGTDGDFVKDAGDVMTGDLHVQATMTGYRLFAGTFSGAGLTDCDADEQALSWNASTRTFVCGDDDGAGAAGYTFAEIGGWTLSDTGDTSTGALNILVTGGGKDTVGLEVAFTTSGWTLHAQDVLRSSGTLLLEGGFFQTGLADCDNAGEKPVYNLTTGLWTCGTDDDVPESGDFGAGVDLETDGSITDGVIDKADLSVSTDYGNISTDGSSNLIIDDGTLVEPDLDADNSPNDGDILAYDSTGTNFTWVDPSTAGGYSFAQIDGWMLNDTGDTMTGQLTVNVTGGGNDTLAYEAPGISSGYRLHANSLLTASGTAHFDGFIHMNAAATITSLPPTVGQSVGWKFGIYDNNYAFGIASNTFAFMTDYWISLFSNDTAPANNGTTSRPDTNAKVSLGEGGQIWAQGAISGSSLTIRNMYTDGGICYSDGTTLQNTAAGTSGQYLISQGAEAPVFRADERAIVFQKFVTTGLPVQSGASLFVVPWAMTIRGLEARVVEAPTGTGVKLDFKKNGVSIFGRLPQIDASANVDDNNHSFASTALALGDQLRMDIVKVGSTKPGSGLVVVVTATRP